MERPSSVEVLRQLEEIADSQNGKVFQFEIVTVNAQGKITNRSKKQANYDTENLPNGVTLHMVSIPAGTFMMGSPESEEGRKDNENQHEVTISPFYMAKYLTTQAQWKAVMGNNPSDFKGDNLPVENVSWNDAVEFCKKLSKITGKNYRLATEAEWEYACRAGTTTPFYFGETITTDLVNYNGNYTYYAPKEDIYHEKTTDVGIFPPNAFGLYDMHGNLWEWCCSESHNEYQGDENTCKNKASLFALRGGSWADAPPWLLTAYRNRIDPTKRGRNIGFRLVRTK